jgi:hypothetical protein
MALLPPMATGTRSLALLLVCAQIVWFGQSVNSAVECEAALGGLS